MGNKEALGTYLISENHLRANTVLLSVGMQSNNSIKFRFMIAIHEAFHMEHFFCWHDPNALGITSRVILFR